MKDLESAIVDVLSEAQKIEGNGVQHLSGLWAVPESTLRILQAELNIYFREYDQKQYDLLEEE